jgi:ketosteroid isomerase-like protein
VYWLCAAIREGRRATDSTAHRSPRDLFAAIESRDPATIWTFFDAGGVVVHPFLGTQISDLPTFEATLGPLLAIFEGLHFFDLNFVPLKDPDAMIVKYSGHAMVSTTGKSYDQTYITEINVRRNKVMRYVEYFDTFVLLSAFGTV